MKLYYEGTKTIMKEDSTTLKLEYYLVEEEKINNNLLYGIKVTEQINQFFKTDYTQPISYSKHAVREIVNTLWCNSVTVSSLAETVDDLMD